MWETNWGYKSTEMSSKIVKGNKHGHCGLMFCGLGVVSIRIHIGRKENSCCNHGRKWDKMWKCGLTQVDQVKTVGRMCSTHTERKKLLLKPKKYQENTKLIVVRYFFHGISQKLYFRSFVMGLRIVVRNSESFVNYVMPMATLMNKKGLFDDNTMNEIRECDLKWL